MPPLVCTLCLRDLYSIADQAGKTVIDDRYLACKYIDYHAVGKSLLSAKFCAYGENKNHNK